LIAELKSSSTLRRDLALVALRTYGPAVVEKLEKAKVDRAVIDSCRGITPEMEAIQKKLDSMKIDLAFDNTKLNDILAFVRDFSGLNIVIDASSKADPNKTITIKTKDLALKNVLKLLLTQFNLDYQITQEQVVLVTDKGASEPVARTPIRIPGASRNAAKEVEALGSDSPAERDRATAALRAMGFGAERSLWDALDSANAEARARGADLLRTLYSPERREQPGPLEQKLRAIRITIDMQNAPLTTIVDYISEISRLSFVFAPSGIPNPDGEVISIKVQDIVLEGALKLMLAPRQLQHAAVGDVVLVSGAGKILQSPAPPFWSTPEEARQMETLLGDLASSDAERQRRAEEELVKMGEPALGPITEASHVFEGPAAERCRALRLKIAESLGAWLIDEPSGVDRQNLTKAQREILGRTLNLKLGNLPLKEVLEAAKLNVSFKAGESLKPAGSFREARLDSLLKAALRPGGLDFYMDGETIVVDTAANVRAAVRK
jgi:hypothetical protein